LRALDYFSENRRPSLNNFNDFLIEEELEQWKWEMERHSASDGGVLWVSDALQSAISAPRLHPRRIAGKYSFFVILLNSAKGTNNYIPPWSSFRIEHLSPLFDAQLISF